MKSPIDNVIVQQMRELTEGGGGPIPAVRSTRRRRNQICIAVLAIGAINLVLYTFIYAAVGGDARELSVFMCGPEGMLRAFQTGLRAGGVRARAIHREFFDWR